MLAMSFAGCAAVSSQSETMPQAASATAEYHKISQADAKALMDEGDAIVIDVREDYEYADGHIDGALLSPLGNLENDIVNLAENKDDLILIYCRSGNRSHTAANILVELGYTNVHDFGGIINWQYGVVQ